MAKKITLKNRTFSSQKEAKEYFLSKMYEIRDSETILESGELFDELLELYTLYCIYSGGEYAEHYKKVAKFTAKNNVTNYAGDEHTTNVSYFVIDEDGKEWDFSIHRAITCVSLNQN